MKFDVNIRHHYWFSEISKIPRASYNEKQISDFVCQFAREHNLVYRQDNFWNVFVFKPASKGAENASPLIMQAHMDMVPARKEGSSHDFEKDPIELVEKDGWLHAKDTTLGADDGLGVAWMLTILEDDTISHPPLECIFSVQEEVGLGGALHMKAEDIQADRMISLDSMDHNVADLCCAGGCYVNATAKMNPAKNDDPTYHMHIGGLTGGHSGTDIHMEKGNANTIAARILVEAIADDIDIRIVSMNCSAKSNVIPSETDVVFVSASDEDDIQNSIKRSTENIRNELSSSDPDLSCSVTSATAEPQCFDSSSTTDLLRFIYISPNGFQHKSMEIEGLTVTSLNLGTITTENNVIRMQWLVRSMYNSAVKDLADKIQICGKMCGISVTNSEFFPGWEYAEVSPIRDKFEKALIKHGDKLHKVAAHGGLEVGVFSTLHPGLDITTVGAVCRNYHTVDEKMDIESFNFGFEILKDILEQCTHD